jgi:hypothetical protein
VIISLEELTGSIYESKAMGNYDYDYIHTHTFPIKGIRFVELLLYKDHSAKKFKKK